MTEKDENMVVEIGFLILAENQPLQRGRGEKNQSAPKQRLSWHLPAWQKTMCFWTMAIYVYVVMCGSSEHSLGFEVHSVSKKCFC
jgi:hypothetical protein